MNAIYWVIIISSFVLGFIFFYIVVLGGRLMRREIEIKVMEIELIERERSLSIRKVNLDEQEKELFVKKSNL